MLDEFDIAEDGVDPTFTVVEELPDGSTVYEVDAEEEADDSDPDFYENLAETLPDSVLSDLCNTLIEGIEDDIASRSMWELALAKGLQYLGLNTVEEATGEDLYKWACKAYDSTLAEALLRFWATARAELFPVEGPCRYDIPGETSDELAAKGERVQDFMNYYLTQEDEDYYPDSDRMLMWVGLAGFAVRKVYQDPITNMPKARFIEPQRFIVNNDCVSLLESDRLTEVTYLSKSTIIQRQMSGFYTDIKLKNINEDDNDDDSVVTQAVRRMQGTEAPTADKRSLFKFYEVNADLDLEGHEHLGPDKTHSGMPLPYVVTISVSDKKIVALKRNWEQNDEAFARKVHYTPYVLFPGFGIYGWGYANLLGSDAIALTGITRELVNAGKLNNYPGGLKVKGLKLENNNKAIGPTEFLDVETGGLPIQDAIMTMPYKEPSQVLRQLREDMKLDAQRLASTADAQVAETKGEVPVGTMLAMLEVSGKIQSSVMRSLHVAQRREFKLLEKLFRNAFMEESFSFASKQRNTEISVEDFDPRISIVPSSDPNATTSTQRVVLAEQTLKLANSAPQLHDLREAYYRMYSAMRVHDIDKLLPKPEEAMPLDPVTENANALENKPLKAAMWQDHASHLATHAQFAENPNMQAHMATHQAMQYLIEMQQAMNIQLPDLESLQDPQIQNQIAMMAAQVAQAQQQEQQAQQPLDPNTVMMADIEQRKEEAALRHEDSKLRAETEAFKATLKHESEQKKLEVQQEIAEEKNEVDLTIAEMKQTV